MPLKSSSYLLIHLSQRLIHSLFSHDFQNVRTYITSVNNYDNINVNNKNQLQGGDTRMMPSTQNDDADFLSLLCSQREILKRLNREKNTITSRPDELKSTRQLSQLSGSRQSDSYGHYLSLETRDLNASQTAASTNHRSFVEVADPLSLMNQPIIERHPSRDELLQRARNQRKISVGFGNDKLSLSTFTALSSTDIIDKMRNEECIKGRHQKYVGVDASTSCRSAERRNILNGLPANVLFFDEDSAIANAPRRFHFTSNLSNKKQIGDDTMRKESKERYKKIKQLDPNIDLSTLEGEFENFALAMDKSIKSQQDIHDWDRMMGLKRSHSKTMRLSMRSRKKLRNVINKC